MSAAHAAPLAVLASSKNGLRSSALSICCGVCCPRELARSQAGRKSGPHGEIGARRSRGAHTKPNGGRGSRDKGC